MIRLEGFSLLTVFLITGVKSLFIGNTIDDTIKNNTGLTHTVSGLLYQGRKIFLYVVTDWLSGHTSLPENEIDRQDQQAESDEVVVGEGLVLEEEEHEYGEDGERQELLDDLELPEVEGAAVVDEPDAVGRHHETVLNERDAPAEENHQRQRQLAEPGRALQLQMTVPRERHEHVRTNQQQKRIYAFHTHCDF